MKSLCYYVFPARRVAFLALIALACASCSNNSIEENKPLGQLELYVGISVQTHDIHNSLKAAQPDEFVVIIYDELDSEILRISRAGDMPDIIELSEGSYYVVAHSDNNVPAAFENDYYYGQSELFAISSGVTTPITLTCVLSNIMVSVVYSPSLISDFDSYVTTVSNSEASLEFDEIETRAGFFNEGPLTIEAILGYTDELAQAQSLTLSGIIPDPEPGKHYEIHIEASLSEGQGSIDLTVDESFETEIVLLSDDEPEMSGELLITEIMFNPSAITDTEGEYIEIKNVSSETVNLMDLVIRRGSNNDMHVIGADIPLLPGEIALLGRSASAAADVDYVYSTISLLNSGDAIFLNHYGTDGSNGPVICRVDYGAAGFITSLNGTSIQLDPSISDVNQASLGSNWCASTTIFPPGDAGSPGEENLSCQ